MLSIFNKFFLPTIYINHSYQPIIQTLTNTLVKSIITTNLKLPQNHPVNTEASLLNPYSKNVAQQTE